MELTKADNMLARWDGFSNLPALKQLGLLIGLAASIALGFSVVLWMQQPSYGVLFGNLSNQETTEVLEVLQQKGIDHQVDKATGALMVPASRLHEIRLALAADGYPKSSNAGFDFLNKQQEFGTSQFIQNARYQRALEEELAKSITSIGTVRSARVHLALPKQSVFVRERRKPSASVVVNLYSGRTLEAEQISAIAHMVASSVPEMEAGQVTIVDQQGRLLSDRKRSAEMARNTSQLEYTRQIEGDYVRRIEDILAPIVGIEGVRAQVNADVDFTITEKTEETYNPDLPALRSEQVLEEKSYGAGVEGIPGALSNQPPGEASVPEQATGENGQPTGDPMKSRRSSTANYELDRTISHTKLSSGVVQRLSVAVVIDDRLVPGEGEEEGTLVRAPWPQEELDRMTALVRDAVGYSARRGDNVNVINASFAPPAVSEIPEQPLWQQAWVHEYGKIGLGVLVILALIFGVMRPVLRGLATSGRAIEAHRPGVDEGRGSGGEGGLGEDRLSLTGDNPTGPTIKLPGPGAYEENLNLVRTVTRDDPKLVANVVRTWVSGD